MKYKFYQNNNNKLIIFFNGWGMDETIVSHLDREDYDLLIIYDYRDLDISLPPIDKYKEKYIVGWSMGVMISSLFDSAFGNVKKYIAINGTLKPINDEYGIPVKIYKLTVRGFNQISCQKFMERMFDTTPPIDKFSNRSLESQKEELQNLMGIEGRYVSFDKVIVSDKDKIIPTKNQLNYWKNPAIIDKIEGGHCPFFKFSKWSEIL